MKLPQPLAEAQELLSALPPQQQLETLIEYGKNLPPFPEEKKTEENKIPGCISMAYLTVRKENEKVYFEGYSDALTIKGYLALLIRSFSGMEKTKFITEAYTVVKIFLETTQLQQQLTPSRANTLGNILKMMVQRAEELQ